jgi:hypothetical protein
MLMSKNAVLELLSDMDGLFAELMNWLAGQYDPQSGGFYYAQSSRLLCGRKPDIESTAQALNFVRMAVSRASWRIRLPLQMLRR